MADLGPGDFVSFHGQRGRINRLDDDEAIIDVWMPGPNERWQATLERKRYPLNDLMVSKPLASDAARYVRVYNRSETSAELVIYSDIGADVFFGGFSAKEMDQELRKLPKGLKDLSVRINSPGGDVFEGMTIYNRLKQIDASITVHVDGLAASIASIIAMAGDEVVVYETSQIMVHKPWTFMGGNADDMRELINRLDQVEAQMIDIYERKTGLERNTLASLLKEETFMTAEEAHSMGFADTVADTDMKLAASFKRPWIKNAA